MNSQFRSIYPSPAVAALFLLAVSSALAQGNSVQFKGAFDYRTAGVVQGGSLVLSGTGAGAARYIGRFSVTYKVTVDFATLLDTGTITLADANGDTINGSLVGQATSSGTPPAVRVWRRPLSSLSCAHSSPRSRPIAP